MPEVLREAVGNVDRRVGDAAQPLAKLDARFRLVQALRRGGIAGLREAERGSAQVARYPDVVAGGGAGAVEREAARHFA